MSKCTYFLICILYDLHVFLLLWCILHDYFTCLPELKEAVRYKKKQILSQKLELSMLALWRTVAPSTVAEKFTGRIRPIGPGRKVYRPYMARKDARKVAREVLGLGAF